MIKHSLTAVLLVSVSSLLALDPASDNPTLVQQFQSVREQTEVIESFRMLKAYQVENFWKSVQDTLKQKDETLAEFRVSLAQLEGDIASLRTTVQQKDAVVEDKEFAGAHISVLGMDLSKSGFVKSFFIIIISLLVLIGVAIWAFRMSFLSARESRNLYDEVCQEFDTYKHRMVEKEVKLLRELQDYRNRVTELKSA